MATGKAYAQVPNEDRSKDTTTPSIDADLINIFNRTTPKKYKIKAIRVTGNRFFDESLLMSISGLAVGDEVAIPGGDNFGKAITKLWGQNYFSEIDIYITSLKGNEIEIEIAVTERPRLSKFIIKGVKKGDQEDLTSKMGLVPSRVVTEASKSAAEEAIRKYYAEKAFRNVGVTFTEAPDPSIPNSIVLTIDINKGEKVKINQINLYGNQTVNSLDLKKQLKGTKEMSRFTLYPAADKGALGTPTAYTFKEYLKDKGYLSFTRTKRVLDPYIRLKFLSSAKYNEVKFAEDKEKLVEYYNSLGYRDAEILRDTQYFVDKGKSRMNIDLRVKEGNQYYFGDITWRGNTKYSDSLLTVILGIKKGDIYNQDLMNKKLGKTLSPEGGDISGLYMDDGYLFFRTEPIETAVYSDTIDYRPPLKMFASVVTTEQKNM